MIKGWYSEQTLVSLSRNLNCSPQLLHINNSDSRICNAAVILLQEGSLCLACIRECQFFSPLHFLLIFIRDKNNLKDVLKYLLQSMLLSHIGMIC